MAINDIEAQKESEGEASMTMAKEALSPGALLFRAPRLNCYIIAVMGCKSSINPSVIMEGLKHTLIKHPRFSSKLQENDGGEMTWIPTTVIIENHVTVADLDPEMDFPERFLEDYVSNLTTAPMDLSKPLWEVHLLNLKTAEAEAVGIFRLHHSLGDGMSLISLILACSRKSSDPEALPTLPQPRQKTPSNSGGFLWFFLAVWSVLSLIWNSAVDIFLFVATVLFLKDTKTPLKGGPCVGRNIKRFVHRTVSLDDFKLVKDATAMTVNDVILGVTQAGLSLYLNRKYGELDEDTERRSKRKHSNDNLPKSIRLRATLLVNVRPTPGIQALADMMAKKSKAKWGNQIGYICVPFSIALQNNPLEYLRAAKATIDRKKHSLEAMCTFLTNKVLTKLFGVKLSAALAFRALSNTTLSLSNVVGPVEEISFYGHRMAYLAPSVYGHPQALTIHFQSYLNKMTIVIAADPTVIPDPHQLCDDLEESLKIFKEAVLKDVLPKDPKMSLTN